MQLLQLDSRHRSNNTHDPGRSEFDLACSISNCKSIELVSASIPTSYYTVAAGRNTFVLTTSLASSTITIAPAIYTMASLASTITATVSLNNFAVTANTTTLRLTFAYNGAFTIQVPGEQMAAVLGLSKGTVHSSSSNNLTSINACELSPPVINITSNSIGPCYMAGTGREIPPTFCVPVDVDAASMINWNYENQFRQKKQYHSDPRDLQQIDITLRDQFGVVLDMNGMNYTLILRIEQ